jgi:hypothetical protein
MPECEQAQKGKIMSFEQKKMIVESLSSVYPMQKFEEEAIKAILDALPQWISCKKELPKLDSRCVLLYSDYTISGGYYRGNRTFDVDYGAEDVNTMVIAWMPLPEAYKGVTE